MTSHYSLHQLGWKPFFQHQLSLEDLDDYMPARVFNIERSVVQLFTAEAIESLPITHSMPELAVGDWILIDHQAHFVRLLERASLFARKAAGTRAYQQYISANVDTVFIVSSLNEDFNLNRIERYLVLAKDAGVEPVILLTKADLCEDSEPFVESILALNPMLSVFAVNALDKQSLESLEPWLMPGNTLAFLGSSGVGKSTLVNSLLGETVQATQGIRKGDSKGKHTTTSRSIYLTTSGVLLLDTPGMRELQLTGCETALEETFADINELSQQCQFSNCRHQSEPGCAILAAIDSGELDPRRLQHYQKLAKEQALNAQTLAEKRAQGKRFSKMVKSVKKLKPRP